MIGFNVRVMQGAQQMSVVNPANFWLLLTLGVVTAVILYNSLRARPIQSFRLAVWVVLILIAFAFVADAAEVKLDRQTQTATIRRFAFYHWTTQTLPLHGIDHAYLHTGAVSSRIVLQFADGHTMALSANDQMSGKPEAVLAINNFLGQT